jgi:non-canonical purine NTP pyrophosphatase (RdgB/HAM1 family)
MESKSLMVYLRELSAPRKEKGNRHEQEVILMIIILGLMMGCKSMREITRFAGENATDEQNNQLLLEKLKETPQEQRTARYQCVLVYMRHALDPTPLICQGTWEGTILFQPSGNNGFGYDPLFYVSEYNCSSAELSPEIKNILSHRGKALHLLHEQLLLKKH